MLSPVKKPTSSFAFFLRYCKYVTNMLFWVLWACLGMGTVWYYHFRDTQSDRTTLQKAFAFVSRQKINFIPYVFLEILQRYANFLFCILWAWLASQVQNNSINLQKTSMFICTPKLHFIICFFLEIYILKYPAI